MAALVKRTLARMRRLTLAMAARPVLRMTHGSSGALMNSVITTNPAVHSAICANALDSPFAQSVCDRDCRHVWRKLRGGTGVKCARLHQSA
jgi:hypothetical protein